LFAIPNPARLFIGAFFKISIWVVMLYWYYVANRWLPVKDIALELVFPNTKDLVYHPYHNQ
jgi:hypothetical protein